MADLRMATNTDKLANARRTLAETTETAVVITTELDRNRATLESARRNVSVCMCVCSRLVCCLAVVRSSWYLGWCWTNDTFL